jgi:hypothetical protein
VPSAAEQQLALSSKQRWFLQSQERLAEDAGGGHSGGGGDLTALKRLERRAGVVVSLDRGAGVATVRARSAAAAKQGVALLQALLEDHACEETKSEEICEEMPIPAVAAAAVVGKGGASIRAIEAASGARLQLVRDGGSTTLRLRGNAGAVAAARALVGEVVADVTSPLLLELDPADVARVLGQGGASIRQIEAETGATLRVEGGGASRGGGSRSGEGAAVAPPRVAVRGSAIQREVAAALLQAMWAGNKRVPFPTDPRTGLPCSAGLIIGKGGETIKGIQVASGGARVDLEEASHAVWLRGSVEQVRLAEQALLGIFEGGFAGVGRSTRCEPEVPAEPARMVLNKDAEDEEQLVAMRGMSLSDHLPPQLRGRAPKPRPTRAGSGGSGRAGGRSGRGSGGGGGSRGHGTAPPPVEQKRPAPYGELYTRAEFHAFYGASDGQWQWEQAGSMVAAVPAAAAPQPPPQQQRRRQQQPSQQPPRDSRPETRQPPSLPPPPPPPRQQRASTAQTTAAPPHSAYARLKAPKVAGTPALSMATDDDLDKFCSSGGGAAKANTDATGARLSRGGAKGRAPGGRQAAAPGVAAARAPAAEFQPTEFLTQVVASIDAQLMTAVVAPAARAAAVAPPRAVAAAAVLSREEVLQAENDALRAELAALRKKR